MVVVKIVADDDATVVSVNLFVVVVVVVSCAFVRACIIQPPDRPFSHPQARGEWTK